MSIDSTKIDLNRLGEKIPAKWRIQSINEYSALCIPYIDARDVMDKLDEVVGAANWQDQYTSIDGQLFGGISIKINDTWITKWDTGTESNTEKEKGQVSDAFKRAAVKWKIGRFLYQLPVQKLKTKLYQKKYYPITDEGEILWNGETLTEFINYKLAKQGTKQNPKRETKQTPKKENEIDPAELDKDMKLIAKLGDLEEAVKDGQAFSPQEQAKILKFFADTEYEKKAIEYLTKAKNNGNGKELKK